MIRLATLMMLAFVATCGTPRRSAPLLANDMPGPLESRLAFQHHCHHCHPHGSSGLGPALNNKPLPALAIKAQVREGLGAMPAFSSQVLPDEHLEQIVKYVQALRRAE